MKKIFLANLLTALFLCIFASSSFSQLSRTGVKKPRSSANQTRTIYGEVDDNVYTNRFFGFKLTIPETWVFQEQEVGDAIKKQGGSMVKGKSNVIDKAFRDAEKRLSILLTFSKDILGMEQNAIVTIGAERATPTIPFRNGNDYLRLNLQTMRNLQLPADFKYSSTIENDTIGTLSIPFIQINRQGYDQRIYSITRKGYALIFTFSYVSDADLNAMREVLRSADLSWNPAPSKK